MKYYYLLALLFSSATSLLAQCPSTSIGYFSLRTPVDAIVGKQINQHLLEGLRTGRFLAYHADTTQLALTFDDVVPSEQELERLRGDNVSATHSVFFVPEQGWKFHLTHWGPARSKKPLRLSKDEVYLLLDHLPVIYNSTPEATAFSQAVRQCRNQLLTQIALKGGTKVTYQEGWAGIALPVGSFAKELEAFPLQRLSLELFNGLKSGKYLAMADYQGKTFLTYDDVISQYYSMAMAQDGFPDDDAYKLNPQVKSISLSFHLTDVPHQNLADEPIAVKAISWVADSFTIGLTTPKGTHYYKYSDILESVTSLCTYKMYYWDQLWEILGIDFHYVLPYGLREK